ncbi:uncharacterized protein MONOS_956 [Monocercomonoides exilis]|uniref:uncharacterized protein n=1 Tax=Monocercomonoides exilis TaxID=2049356 RepID=UPI00355A7B2E|nr:hypothetical protein MONOS_956 [Monocercomonoides exilis]
MRILSTLLWILQFCFCEEFGTHQLNNESENFLTHLSPTSDYSSILSALEEGAANGHAKSQEYAGLFNSIGLGFKNGFFRNSSSINWGNAMMYYAFAAEHSLTAKKLLAFQLTSPFSQNFGGFSEDCEYAAQLYSEISEQTLVSCQKSFLFPDIETSWLFVIPPCVEQQANDSCIDVKQGLNINVKNARKYNEFVSLIQSLGFVEENSMSTYEKRLFLSDFETGFQSLSSLPEKSGRVHCLLGIMYMYGLGTEISLQDAHAHFVAGIAKGNTRSYVGLAFLKIMEHDYGHAYKLARAAANEGEYEGMYLAGILSLIGPSPVKRNMDYAEQMLNKAALNEHLTATYHYANILLQRRAMLIYQHRLEAKGYKISEDMMHELNYGKLSFYNGFNFFSGSNWYEKGDHLCKEAIRLLQMVSSASPNTTKSFVKSAHGISNTVKMGLIRKHNKAQQAWMEYGLMEELQKSNASYSEIETDINMQSRNKNSLPSQFSKKSQKALKKQIETYKKNEKNNKKETEVWSDFMEAVSLAMQGNVEILTQIGEACMKSEGGDKPCVGGMRGIDFLLVAAKHNSHPALLLLGDFLRSLKLYRQAAFMYVQASRSITPFRFKGPYSREKNMNEIARAVPQKSINLVEWVKSLSHWMLSPTIRSIKVEHRLVGEGDALIRLALMVAKKEIGVRWGCDVVRQPNSKHDTNVSTKEKSESAEYNSTNDSLDEMLEFGDFGDEVRMNSEKYSVFMTELNIPEPDMLSSSSVNDTFQRNCFHSTAMETKKRKEVIQQLFGMAMLKVKRMKLFLHVMYYVIIMIYFTDYREIYSSMTHRVSKAFGNISWDTYVLIFSVIIIVFELRRNHNSLVAHHNSQQEDTESENDNENAEMGGEENNMFANFNG